MHFQNIEAYKCSKKIVISNYIAAILLQVKEKFPKILGKSSGKQNASISPPWIIQEMKACIITLWHL